MANSVAKIRSTNPPKQKNIDENCLCLPKGDMIRRSAGTKVRNHMEPKTNWLFLINSTTISPSKGKADGTKVITTPLVIAKESQ
jgi:hypothetical protein